MVLLHEIAVDRVFKYVNLGRGELASADSLLEKNIHFREGTARWFRYPKISVDDAEEADSTPEEARVIAPIPRSRVEHVRSQNAADDAHDNTTSHVSISKQGRAS